MVRAQLPTFLADSVELALHDLDTVANLHVRLDDLVLPDSHAVRLPPAAYVRSSRSWKPAEQRAEPSLDVRPASRHIADVSFQLPDGPELVPPPVGSWRPPRRPASFDELLDHGRAMAATGEARQQELRSKARAAADELEEWRDSLRLLGRWFAKEARDRGVPSLPLHSAATTRPAPTPPKGRWFRRQPPPEPSTPVARTTRGWALFPLDRRTGEAHRGGWRHYGGTSSMGEVLNPKTGYLCLAVDQAGLIRVGVEQEDCIVATRRPSDVIVGMTPDEITPVHLVSVVNNMSAESTRPFDDPMQDLERLQREHGAQKHREGEILSLYVAYAQRILAER